MRSTADLKQFVEVVARSLTGRVPAPVPATTEATGDLAIAVFGEQGVALLGTNAAFIKIKSTDVGHLDARTGGRLKILIVDGDLAPSAPARALAQEARALGARVIATHGDLVEADATLGHASGPPWLHAVDPKSAPYLPLGSRYHPVVVSGFRVIPGASGAAPIDAQWPLRADDLDRVGAALSQCWKVQDGPHSARTSRQRAEALLAMASAGVPVVATGLDDESVALLGRELAELLGTSFDGATARDRHLARLRAAALRWHGPRQRIDLLRRMVGYKDAGWPLVSIILATRRPEKLASIINQIRNFSYEPFELVLALHGDGFGDVEELVDGISRVRVLRRPADRVFGKVLRDASELARISHQNSSEPKEAQCWRGRAEVRGVTTCRDPSSEPNEHGRASAVDPKVEPDGGEKLGLASGEILTKMDDDDWYAPSHLHDLVIAHDLSGADLVGKATEFVYFAASDRTVRRATVAAERLGPTGLSGGTLSLKASMYRLAGGWRPVRRYVDKLLVEDVSAAGGKIFLTQGFGYLLHRHGDHTWAASDDSLTQRLLTAPRLGLDKVFAGVQ